MSRLVCFFLLLSSFSLCFASDLASHTLVLDGAFAGNAIVAVGERGTILRSVDNAATWTAAKPLTTATLTGVCFADAQHGWAVGHDALILGTSDGGVTWSKQWQGDNLSDSFLDVIAFDTKHVIAVGAYGLYLTSADAGRHWEHRKILPDDYHFNRISRGPTGTLYLAGEHGTLLRSRNGGNTWAAIPTVYEGSFYGVLPLTEQTLLAYGLRGRIYRSTNDGQTWSAVLSGQTELIASAVQLGNRTIVLAGQVRGLLVSTDAGLTFVRHPSGITTGVAEIMALPNDGLLALGENGAAALSPSTVELSRGGERTPPGDAASASSSNGQTEAVP